eukprot:m.15823 g.15823  ORF g.15823 m.15823 type:complete len:405 (-) comp10818_c0_seq1:2148-3362(-)
MASAAESPKLSVLCCTANIGNTRFDDLKQWIPREGIVAQSDSPIDIIAVGMQESVFSMGNEDSQSMVLLDENCMDNFDDSSKQDPASIHEEETSTAAAWRKVSEPLINHGLLSGSGQPVDDSGCSQSRQTSQDSDQPVTAAEASANDPLASMVSPPPIKSSRKNRTLLLSTSLDNQMFRMSMGEDANVGDSDTIDGVCVLEEQSSDSSSDDDDSTDPAPAAESAWRALVLDKIDAKCSTHILHVLTQHLGPRYALVQTVRRWQMRLLVFHHDNVSIPKESVECSWKNTGVGVGVRLANKGGQVISLDVVKEHTRTPLCFVSCHLAAHEGGRHLKVRNRSVRDIMEHVEIRKRQVDFSARHPYTFWMGDMNYRINMISNADDGDHDTHWQRVHDLIATTQRFVPV